MRISIFKSVSLFAAVSLACLAAAAIPARASYLPSLKIGTAPLVSPSSADGFYGATTTATDGLALITHHATPVAPEIVELARALKADPDLIYHYVRNNIETDWTYGLSKGPLGAAIDKSGTAFDQAALMVALLRQSGIPASYQAGTVSLTTAQFGASTGLIHSLALDPSGNQTFFVDAKAACQFLAASGIPATVEGTQDCSTLTGDLPSTGTPIVMAHVWVVATLPPDHGNCTCLFDPATKTHAFRLGFAQTAVGMTSGDPLVAAVSTMDSGTVSSLSYVHNLSESALTTKLNLYSANYLAYIKAHNLQGNQIEDVVSGMVLTPDNSSLRQTTLPYPATATHSWTAIPDQYRTTLEAAAVETVTYALTPPQPPQNVPLFDTKFFADEIYGRRLSVTTNFNQNEIGTEQQYDHYIVSLRLDDVALTSIDVNPFHPDSHAPVSLTLQIDHPYAAAAAGEAVGTYMDARNEGGGIDHSIVKNVILDTPMSIVAAWGMTGSGLLTKWSDEKAGDAPLPLKLANYGSCETCHPATVELAGDYAREKAQASYLAQNTRATKIHAGLASSVAQIHHVIGVVYADDYMDDNGLNLLPVSGKDYNIADTYTRLDIDEGMSLTSQTSDMASRNAALQAIAATSATIEGSIIAQSQDVPDTSSTATRFEWGNAPTCADPNNLKNCDDPASVSGSNPRKFFQFNPGGATVPSEWVLWENYTYTHIPAETPMDGYGNPQKWGAFFQTALAQDIAAYQAAGFQVTASQESFLGPGQRGGYMKLQNPTQYPGNPPQEPGYESAATKQRGGALVATKYDSQGNPIEIAHDVVGLLAVGSDGSILPTKGGGGGAQPDTGATYNPADAGD
ncbi:MAG TPA: transglutaminase domain-containing protein, partial [Rhizomicrobium sp.]